MKHQWINKEDHGRGNGHTATCAKCGTIKHQVGVYTEYIDTDGNLFMWKANKCELLNKKP